MQGDSWAAVGHIFEAQEMQRGMQPEKFFQHSSHVSGATSGLMLSAQHQTLETKNAQRWMHFYRGENYFSSLIISQALFWVFTYRETVQMSQTHNHIRQDSWEEISCVFSATNNKFVA